jgi:hypothetical protein
MSSGDTNQVYLVPAIKGEQVAMEVTAADRDAEDKNIRRRSTPPALRLLTRSSPDRGSVRIVLIQYFLWREDLAAVWRKAKERPARKVLLRAGCLLGQVSSLRNLLACSYFSPAWPSNQCLYFNQRI